MVTGSCYLVDTDDVRFLVDCGMFQGGKQIEQRNQTTRNYRVKELSGIFITHAHIDHSGLVPRLVRQGYAGPVWATEATCDLLKILWLDSAHIQEMEAEWQTRKNKRQHRPVIEPLYETADAEEAIRLLVPLPMDEIVEPLDGVRARYVTAGHILGAGSLYLELTNHSSQHRLGFSGDLGRPGQLIIPDPEELPQVDTLFMETTYGGRLHKGIEASIEELIQVVNDAYRDGGKVIIPAFAVERTQEIIYTLAGAWRENRIPQDMPVFLDSPLAISATQIFQRHPELYDDEALALMDNGHTPINLPSLRFTPSTEDSRKINDHKGPAVIIAGNGMASAGRVKHHLKHNLWQTNCHVVIVGFQAEGTLGRQLVEGRTRVRLFREEVVVRAKVHTIGGFSAHADQNELLAWLTPLAHPGLKVNLIHGEESGAMTFKQVAQARFPKVQFNVPQWREVIQLGPVGEVEAPAPIPRELLAVRTEAVALRLERFHERMLAGLAHMDSASLAILEKALDQVERTTR
jgi:metallo-beta-lactamase family protein